LHASAAGRSRSRVRPQDHALADIEDIGQRREMTMLRHLVLALGAAALIATAPRPDDALANHRGSWHRSARHGHEWRPDPRASRSGYYGPHYGRDCYRAANGRSICPVLFREL
jgi:hypothetical protein